MEKSRAIDLLKLAVPIKALTQQEHSDFVEAVNMGMDALEQPTSPDTIDRNAALKALRKCQTYLYDARDPELKIELSSAEAAINSLPPAQPELTDEQAIAHLQSSGWMQRHDKEMYESGLNEQLADDSDSYDSLLPTIQPEPKEGHWINGKCDLCGEHAPFWCMASTYHESNYCPNCGARMKGEPNE